VFRSTDGGASWARLAPLPPTVAGAQGFGEDACSDASMPAPMAAPVPPLYGVTWAGPSTVYITGGLDGAGPGDVATVYASPNATAPVPAFALVSFRGGQCFASLAGSEQDPLTDAYGVPSNPRDVLFVSTRFGKIVQTTDGFNSPLVLRGDTVNDYTGIPRMAVDPHNPANIWVADQETDLCYQCLTYSRDGGATSHYVSDTTPLHSALFGSLSGVGFAGGTLIAAGTGGLILVSHDGMYAAPNPARGALAHTNWLAASVADATHALVGGDGGALVELGRLGPGGSGHHSRPKRHHPRHKPHRSGHKPHHSRHKPRP